MKQTLFYNFSGRDYPDYATRVCDSMLVADGRIIKTDFGLDALKKDPDITGFDLNGAVVFPGFTDSHVHFMQTGIECLGVRVDKADCLDEVFDLISHSVAKDDHEVVLVWGFDETRLRENRIPTIRELDAAAGGRGLWLSRVDLHSAFANTKTLDFLKGHSDFINGTDPFISGEKYYRANVMIVAGLSESMKLDAMSCAEKLILQQGVTTIHALEGWGDGDERHVQSIADYFKTSDLHGIIFHQSKDPSLAAKNGWNRLGGCLLVDGSFGSRTAALEQPYSDAPDTHGNVYMSCDEMEALLVECTNRSMQSAMHVIGDKAANLAVSTHRWLSEKYGKPILPHRLEHFVLPSDKAIMGARQAGLTICVQPVFDHFWGGPAGMYEKRLGKKRTAKTNPFKTMLDIGIPLIAGSDSPVTPVNPMLGIHAFVNHNNPDERIRLNNALSAFIYGPHATSDQKPVRGRLEDGCFADFVCLDTDPFLIPGISLKKLTVKAVFAKGKQVSD